MTIETALSSFALGLLATTSPCVLPLYPGFLAYLAGDPSGWSQPRAGVRYLYGIAVLAGVLTMMLALGFVFSVLSISLGRALSILIPLADLVIIAFGMLLLLGINPFQRLPQVRIRLISHPLVNAFVYGLLYGPIALPCSGPLVVGVFAFSLTAEELLGRLSVFLWFGLGFGVPLLFLSFLTGATQRWLTRVLARHHRAIELAGGAVLVAAGILDLAQNWQFIRPYLV